VDADGNPLPWLFTVHKHASSWRLAALIGGALAGVALVIQGSISILAWIAAGFRAAKGE
jgi:hypothetical protein